MDGIEFNIATKYQAEYVEIKAVNEKKTLNGKEISNRSFFSISVIESDFLNTGRKNDRFLRIECEEIVRFLLDSTTTFQIAPYDIVEFKIQEKKGLMNKLETSSLTLPLR